jgi:hypothetical protein
MGSVFNNQTLELDVFFTLLPSRNCTITAKAIKKDGTVFHLSGMSSLFGKETDFFLHNSQMSIIASVKTDGNNNITSGQCSGFQTNGGWTGYWWTEAVTPVK